MRWNLNEFFLVLKEIAKFFNDKIIVKDILHQVSPRLSYSERDLSHNIDPKTLISNGQAGSF
ncbi:hypothetical protein GAMM_10001 [Gammaproteobacteria bacterium]